MRQVVMTVAVLSGALALVACKPQFCRGQSFL